MQVVAATLFQWSIMVHAQLLSSFVLFWFPKTNSFIGLEISHPIIYLPVSFHIL